MLYMSLMLLPEREFRTFTLGKETQLHKGGFAELEDINRISRWPKCLEFSGHSIEEERAMLEECFRNMHRDIIDFLAEY